MAARSLTVSLGSTVPTKAIPDPFALPAWIASGVLALTLPVVMAVVVLAAEPAPLSSMERMASVSGARPAELYEGQQLYHQTCAACHGADGSGVVPLGKPLKNSAFVRGSDDKALFEVITNGRMPKDAANTTGALMPPRGARNLSDEQVRRVIAYTRAIQDPGAPDADTTPWRIVEPGSGPAVVAAGPGGVDVTGLPGHDLFIASCSACHGADANGVEGAGVALLGSDFVNAKGDKDLLNFIKSGRPVWDPESKTGVDMPPKGGNPALGEDQINEIIAYLRSLNEGVGG
jgi:mono/diheme cytochrome c family protein